MNDNKDNITDNLLAGNAMIARYVHRALTAKTESERNHCWFLTAFSVEHVFHILQDMAVPAHVRNDWIWNIFSF